MSTNDPTLSVKDLAAEVVEFFIQNKVVEQSGRPVVVDVEEAMKIVLLDKFPPRVGGPIWYYRAAALPEKPPTARFAWMLAFYDPTVSTPTSHARDVLALIASHVEDAIKREPAYSGVFSESASRKARKAELLAAASSTHPSAA